MSAQKAVPPQIITGKNKQPSDSDFSSRTEKPKMNTNPDSQDSIATTSVNATSTITNAGNENDVRIVSTSFSPPNFILHLDV